MSVLSPALITPNDIHNFWYEGYKNENLYNLVNVNLIISKWFMKAGGADFDAFQYNSKKIINDAADDLLIGDEWYTPKGCLTRVILLDQFTRTVYKGTKNAFKFDPIALSITLQVLEQGWFQTEYTAMEIFTFLLVLVHSEKIEYQLLGND
jgi:uncharacterized protein (DUF924 family)